MADYDAMRLALDEYEASARPTRLQRRIVDGLTEIFARIDERRLYVPAFVDRFVRLPAQIPGWAGRAHPAKLAPLTRGTHFLALGETHDNAFVTDVVSRNAPGLYKAGVRRFLVEVPNDAIELLRERGDWRTLVDDPVWQDASDYDRAGYLAMCQQLEDNGIRTVGIDSPHLSGDARERALQNAADEALDSAMWEYRRENGLTAGLFGAEHVDLDRRVVTTGDPDSTDRSFVRRLREAGYAVRTAVFEGGAEGVSGHLAPAIRAAGLRSTSFVYEHPHETTRARGVSVDALIHLKELLPADPVDAPLLFDAVGELDGNRRIAARVLMVDAVLAGEQGAVGALSNEMLVANEYGVAGVLLDELGRVDPSYAVVAKRTHEAVAALRGSPGPGDDLIAVGHLGVDTGVMASDVPDLVVPGVDWQGQHEVVVSTSPADEPIGVQPGDHAESLDEVGRQVDRMADRPGRMPTDPGLV